MQPARAIALISLFFFTSFANCKTAYSSSDLYILYYEYAVSHKLNRFDVKLIVKAVNGCTKNESLMCSATRKILEYKVRNGSESAALLLAAQTLEIDPVKNRSTSDRILNELLLRTKDGVLKKQLVQVLTSKVSTKQKTTKDTGGQSGKVTGGSSVEKSEVPLKNEKLDDSDSDNAEATPPKRLTIIFSD